MKVAQRKSKQTLKAGKLESHYLLAVCIEQAVTTPEAQSPHQYNGRNTNARSDDWEGQKR